VWASGHHDDVARPTPQHHVAPPHRFREDDSIGSSTSNRINPSLMLAVNLAEKGLQVDSV